MIEFTLVLIAVVAVIATKWEGESRWQMGVGGFLSFALGLRVMALVTATYLFPCFADGLLADEPVVAAPAEATNAEATTAENATAEKATAEKATAEKATAEKATAEKATAEKATAENATAENATAENATAENATAEKATAEKATAEKATAEKATAEKATAEKATAEKATAEKATAEKATAEKATAEKATAEKATAEKATAEKATAEKATAEKATAEKATAEKATAEKTTAENATPERATAEKTTVEASVPPTGNSESTITAPLTRPSEPDVQKDARPAVAFITNVKYLTPNRPSWVESAPTYEGELYKVSVRAGPYRTIRDCEPDLEQDAKKAVAEFINDHLRAQHASAFFPYSLKDLRSRKVVRDQFSEQLETSLGLMNQVHAQLVFDDGFRKELDERWSEIKSKGRLAQTGLGAGIVLLFLGTMFSFLKLDTVTRGYYTGRLQFGAAATILALVAASVLLMKWIPWM